MRGKGDSLFAYEKPITRRGRGEKFVEMLMKH